LVPPVEDDAIAFFGGVEVEAINHKRQIEFFRSDQREHEVGIRDSGVALQELDFLFNEVALDRNCELCLILFDQ
jgi:hypothetical protein